MNVKCVNASRLNVSRLNFSMAGTCGAFSGKGGGAVPQGCFLLAEDGGTFLLEAGGKIALEGHE